MFSRRDVRLATVAILSVLLFPPQTRCFSRVAFKVPLQSATETPFLVHPPPLQSQATPVSGPRPRPAHERRMLTPDLSSRTRPPKKNPCPVGIRWIYRPCSLTASLPIQEMICGHLSLSTVGPWPHVSRELARPSHHKPAKDYATQAYLRKDPFTWGCSYTLICISTPFSGLT